MRLGVLIIGSLLWEQRPHRSEWRSRRLNILEQTPVKVPIRYGRCSRNRNCTYTMVFSELVCRADYGMGQGLIVTCKQPVASLDDLIEEVDELWKAESVNGNLTTRLHASWGGVGVLFRDIESSLCHGWRLWVRRSQRKYPALDCCKSEAPMIQPDGMLGIPWPVDSRNSTAANVDILLATATEPSLRDERYPRSGEIARAWVADESGQEEYFFKNVAAGIRTFQDETIWRFLSKCKKSSEYREEYPGAADMLDRENTPSA